MKIVVDTNVLISGVFFGGYPRRVLSAIVNEEISACTTKEIIDEYEEVIQEMIRRKQGHINSKILAPLFQRMKVIETSSRIEVSRDPDDNKFLECATDAKAMYVVSGDKDLLILEQYDDIQIVTAKDFCEKYLLN